MPEVYADIANVVLAAVLGVCGGYLVKRWDVAHQARKVENDVWRAQRHSHWSPLLRATRELEGRFAYLRDIYLRRPGMPFDPESISGDFRELYVLSRAEIPNLQDVDPTAARRDHLAVQRMRARVCHELTFAESSLFKTVTYLGHAEHVFRDLVEDRLDVPAEARDDVLGLLRAVRASLQGATGAGVFEEQQEYIGQMAWNPPLGVITNLEFRQQLFDLPGWEGFKNVLRFFAEFGPKVEYEIAETIETLGRLAARLDHVRGCATKRDYRPLVTRDAPLVPPRPASSSGTAGQSVAAGS